MEVPFPEGCKLVKAQFAAANANSCDRISTENCNKLWWVISHSGTTDVDLTLSLYEATAATGGTSAAITATCPYWLDSDHGTTSDVLVRQTDAYSLTIDPATAGGTLAVIEWDPAKHTQGYPWVYLSASGGSGSNYLHILAVLDMKYKTYPLPAVIS